MKQTIQIDIEYPDCDTLIIDADDVKGIENEITNLLYLVEKVAEHRFSVNAKLIKETKLDIEDIISLYNKRMSVVLEGNVTSAKRLPYGQILENRAIALKALKNVPKEKLIEFIKNKHFLDIF